MSGGVSYPLFVHDLPKSNDDYFNNHRYAPYKRSVTLQRYSGSVFNNLIGYNPQPIPIQNFEQRPIKKTKKSKSVTKKRKLRKNIKRRQNNLSNNVAQPVNVRPTFWQRAGRWFVRQYEGLNNFIEQPYTTTMNLFRDNPEPPKKITFSQAATQSAGNIALKIVAMPILAPLAIAGLMYTSIKPMIQYWKQQ